MYQLRDETVYLQDPNGRLKRNLKHLMMILTLFDILTVEGRVVRTLRVGKPHVKRRMRAHHARQIVRI